MSTYVFKTNIHCNSCISKISPELNKNIEIESWEVDINSENKLLTIQTDLNIQEIKEIIQKAGYYCELSD